MTTQYINFTYSAKKTTCRSSSPFLKLPFYMIAHIQSFLQFKEFIATSRLASYFRKAGFASKEPVVGKDCLKYMLYLVRLENDSGPHFSPYLNVFMSINIISISTSQFNSIQFQDQIEVLTMFIVYRYQTTKNKRFQVDLYDIDSYNRYYAVLSQLPFRNELKITLNISQEIASRTNDILPLFSIITPIYLDHFTETIYSKIQSELFKQKIKAYHYRLFGKNSESIEEAKVYFKQFPNHLYCVTSSQSSDLAQYNESSITTITGRFPYDLSEACKSLRVKKIKADYPCEELNEMLSIIKDYSLCTTYGGFTIIDTNICDYYLSLINSSPQLNSLSMIQFNDEEEDEVYSRFDYFFNHLSKEAKQKIKKITFWCYMFRKETDYHYLMKEFPKLKALTTNNDFSSIYDDKFEIDKIFACFTKKLTQSELKFILFLLNNNLKDKAIGRQCFKLNLLGDVDKCSQFLNYLHQEGENSLLNSINTIDNLIELNSFEGFSIPHIQCINYFEIKSENIELIPLLKNVQRIKEISIFNNDLFIKHCQFIKDKKPFCLVYLDNNGLEIIKEIELIKSLKYLKVPYEQFKEIEQQISFKTIQLIPYIKRK